MRRARHAADADARQLRQAAEAGLVTLIDTGEAVLTGDREESMAGLRERIGADRLGGAVMACRAVASNDARGVVDAVIARYPDLRKSLPAFWSLPFASDTGRDDLLTALDVVRRLDQGAIKALPEDVPTDFIPAGWQKALRDDRGQLRRSLWETALALAVRDALRSAMRCGPVISTFPTAVSTPGSGPWCWTNACGRAPARPAMPISACPTSRRNTSPSWPARSAAPRQPSPTDWQPTALPASIRAN